MVFVAAQDERLRGHDLQLDPPRNYAGAGGDLALVEAGVAFPDVLDLQDPVVGALFVEHLEPGVRGVRHHAVGQDVPVAQPHPRYLSGST